MADGFLGRWSKRKLEVKEGKAVEAEPAPQPPPQPTAESGRGSEGLAVAPSPSAEEGRDEGAAAVDAQQPPDPPPTLADVADLTPQSDFRRFIARDVTPDVKSAAMKKLFADPHFNVMDRLDTYIDDYSQPDPIPESMLRQLASAQFLGLFREEDRKDEDAAGVKPATDELPAQSVAQSGAPDEVSATDGPASPSAPEPDAAPDAHADLRLQQDDAPAGGEPGHGAG
jgi:hypothetical protein